MSKLKNNTRPDAVLLEVWRAKDVLSSQYGHDLHRLFAETCVREALSGHPLVSLGDLKKDPSLPRKKRIPLDESTL
jgi:hypothetical protein